ncbi:nuclear RNA polymerase D1B [Artemisia annua]|uniref:Nuclear RNA polymerase D1B n=1 Tax=Artemisia annua TaxID=35608 RepID=A0A2U1MLP4_ARTAN|nr:nuclear RNA polymerase D1B [Artemisia annua]
MRGLGSPPQLKPGKTLSLRWLFVAASENHHFFIIMGYLSEGSCSSRAYLRGGGFICLISKGGPYFLLRGTSHMAMVNKNGSSKFDWPGNNSKQVLIIRKKIHDATKEKLASRGCFFHEGYIMQHLPVPPKFPSTPDVSDGINVMSSFNISFLNLTISFYAPITL